MKAKILALKDERIMVWTLMWFIIGMCILYIYFVNETVFNVAKRTQAEQEASVLNSSLSELEFKYISMRNNIDIDLAYSLGYKDIKEPRYVSKAPVTAVVSQNTVQ